MTSFLPMPKHKPITMGDIQEAMIEVQKENEQLKMLIPIVAFGCLVAGAFIFWMIDRGIKPEGLGGG